MSIQKGDSVILKAGDNLPSESFYSIGGVEITSLNIVNSSHNSSNLESGNYQKLLPSTGIKKVKVGLEGLFSDNSAEEFVRSDAFSGAQRNYELHFGNGDKLTGAFIVKEYSRKAEQGGLERFSLVIDNAGEVWFVKG